MRTAFILLLLLLTNSVFSQDSFAKQLRQVINDTANHFQKFQGTVKEVSDTESTYFNSTLILEGTKENTVINHRSICGYDARIADSVTKSKGKKILEDWKIKLVSAGFNMVTRNVRKDSQFIDGWYFSKGNFSLSIDLTQYFYDKNFYGVSLLIANEHPRPKMNYKER